MIDTKRPAPRKMRLRGLTTLIFLGLIASLALPLQAREKAAPEVEVFTPNLIADLAEQALPSVVAVYVKYDRKQEMAKLHERIRPYRKFFDDPSLREFFEMPEEGEEGDTPTPGAPEARTSGSGVIISEKGYIVTNNHIVEAAVADDGSFDQGRISVVLDDDTEIPPEKVTILAADSLLDIALLKVDTEGLNLRALRWGDSDKMRIGDWVIAIGNPLDLRGSVSKGIISAKGREIGKVGIEHLLQTDAMINPGNSGGALLNLKGELIGINMAIATTSGYFQGIGFAIPSADAQYISDQVIEHGEIRRGYIGIEMVNLDDKSMRQALGITEYEGGILIKGLRPGAPAEEAGLERYDVIIEVDDRKIADTGDLLEMIASKHVGDVANIKVLRAQDGKVAEREFEMKVKTRPSDRELSQILRTHPWSKVTPPEAEPEGDDFGLQFEPIKSGDRTGLEVTEVEAKSTASRAGIAVGDVLIDVDRRSVGSVEAYEEAIGQAPADAPVLVRFYSQRAGREVLATLTRRPKPDNSDQ